MLKLALRRLWPASARWFQIDASKSLNAPPPLAFVFDLDGVLLQGPRVIPAAKRALNMLEGDNPFRRKIPYIFLTNGGGVSEADRCKQLTELLGVTVGTHQYLQAHTILRTLAGKYEDRPVLVLGGKLDTVRRVAVGYGYRKAFTTLDVLAWNPSVWPFYQVSSLELQTARRDVNFSQTPIRAAFVFHDPRNWALDIQILCDVIRSNGVIGGPYVTKQEWENEPVELIFCNPDLLWKSDFERPRLGQGAFREAFQGVFKALTGATYPYVQYGKPTVATYRFAENALKKHIEEILGAQQSSHHIYMVGDNPESDIAGANSAGWSSILVQSGVYDPHQGPPSHQPLHITEDMESAVKWAIDRELA